MGRIRARTLDNSGLTKIVTVFENYAVTNCLEYTFSKDVNEIFDNPDIDAIFICTPNHLNKTFTIKGLNAGKNVFCEKPPAFTASDVEEIIEVEKKSRKKLMYGFNHRHHESIQYMKNLINSNEYGNVIWMRGRYGKSVDEAFFDTWRAKKDLAGGGILLDQGIHMLDLFLMLGGEFDSVQSDVSNHYWKLDIEDNVFAIYKNTKTGMSASLHSTMTQWRHLFSLEVFLEKGYMVLNGLKTSSGAYGDEVLSIAKNRTTAPAATWEDEECLTFETNNSWESEINHFIDSINNDTQIQIGNSRDALSVMRLIEKTYKNGGNNE